MNPKTFEKPVYLKQGKYLVREITTVDEAIDFLEEWPEEKRDLIHETAYRTCLMAHDGQKPLGVARDAIRAFGKKKGILEKAPEVRPINQVSGGRVPA
ncbi:DUF982 domain-containing protein [Pseudaminobacter sp. 19-2017]|uniref:DUF982 domain-containing protein n=1 Tax=Pseudaminobacter soli (ex Zhang et al. 2022) TaxID=2831468 RepID=A0A942EBZ6_9HYPH|nr:DUF982 domain-containing protein [Pseudaminobacter soli]MBS3652347.1 DUF982 domain-containing protein [Pseudaminobacter soli]